MESIKDPMTNPPSAFSWLDYSEAERRRMNEVIGLFRDQGILDELGLGSVRDAFADLFYPGTSTIQTRARYFLFIPWIYLGIEKERVPPSQVSERARADQIKLVFALERGGEKSGVIGIDAREHLLRLPHSIYWNGMALYGVRQFRGTLEQYHRSLDAFYARVQQAPRFEEGERFDLGLRANWHPELPDPPRKWDRVTAFSLTHEEADYLMDRITSEKPDSLLSHLLQRGSDVRDIQAPWTDPDLAALPPNIKTQLQHARNFSEVMLGASALYNAMLAQAAERDELLHSHLEALASWAERVLARRGELVSWDRKEFWDVVRHINPRISYVTEGFVESWVELSLEAPDSLFDSDVARRFITEREHRLKHRLARLTNPKALETWGGTSSVTPLSYRWNPNARQIVSDILDGLKQPTGIEQLVAADA